jgi:hypothetical protein
MRNGNICSNGRTRTTAYQAPQAPRIFYNTALVLQVGLVSLALSAPRLAICTPRGKLAPLVRYVVFEIKRELEIKLMRHVSGLFSFSSWSSSSAAAAVLWFWGGWQTTLEVV